MMRFDKAPRKLTAVALMGALTVLALLNFWLARTLDNPVSVVIALFGAVVATAATIYAGYEFGKAWDHLR